MKQLCTFVGVLALSGSANLSAAPTHHREQAGRHHQQASRNEQQPPPTAVPAPAEYSVDPDPTDPKCYYRRNHDSADLCSQWRAALAAEKANDRSLVANWISTGGAALSLLALILLFRNIRQTNESLDEAREGNNIAAAANKESARRAESAAEETALALSHAKQSADAAVKLVEISQRNAELDLRAYLYVRSVIFREAEDFDVAGYTITAEVVNTGRTPATVKAVRLRAKWLAASEKHTMIDVDVAVRFAVNIDTPVTLPFAFSEPKTIDGEHGRIAVDGVITYADVFGNDDAAPFLFTNNGGLTFDELDSPTRLNATAYTPVTQEAQKDEDRKK